MLQLISLLMENKPGALMRVTGLISARGYNIESLTVARTLDPELSRMSIVVDVEPNQRAQVLKQMNKLINVLQATDLTEREREICATLAPALRERGLLFVGIDVIDGFLTEINVTSPTGIRAIARLDGPDVAAMIWDVIEKKRGGK